MTVREYISQKLRAWNITEAMFIDILADDVNPDDVYSEDNAQEVGKAMVGIIEELTLSPYMSNVNENGFSVSWDYSKVGQYYQWLCRKYDVDQNTDVVAALGISTIIDKSDIW